MTNALIRAAAMLAALCAPALADAKTDRSIDRSAARLLAARIGDLRGTIAPGEATVFVSKDEAEITGSVRPGQWVDGLARAHDPLAPEPAQNDAR